MPNPLEDITSMDWFQQFDKEMYAYMKQIFGLTKVIPEAIRLDLELLKEPDMIHILGSILDSSKSKTNIDVGKAIEEITNFALKIVRNEKINEKIYIHARDKLFSKIKRLHTEAGFTVEDRLYQSFGSRILKQLDNVQRAKDYKERTVPLGKPDN